MEDIHKQKLPRSITYSTNKKKFKVDVKACYIGIFTDFRDAIKARNKERLRLTIKACKNFQKQYHKENE